MQEQVNSRGDRVRLFELAPFDFLFLGDYP